jgi:hypothetical protein
MVVKIRELVQTERAYPLLHHTPTASQLVGAQRCMFDLVTLDQRRITYWREPLDSAQEWLIRHWFETQWSEGFEPLRLPLIHQHVLNKIRQLVEMEHDTVLLRMGIDRARLRRQKPHRSSRVPPEQTYLRPVGVYHVYFARDRASGDIKIGTSKNVRKVSSEIKRSIDLLATMDGNCEVESIMHCRFAHARIRGEWFRPVPELLAYIESIKERVV